MKIIKKSIFYIIKFLLISYICYRLLFICLCILDYYNLLNVDLSVYLQMMVGNNPSPGNSGIPTDPIKNYPGWLDNLGPILAGYGALKGMERIASVNPGTRIGIAVGVTGVLTGLNVLDKVITNSVGANRLIVAIQEIVSGQQVTSVDSIHGKNPLGDKLSKLDPQDNSELSKMVEACEEIQNKLSDSSISNFDNWTFMRNIGNKVLDTTIELANPVLVESKKRLAEATALTTEAIKKQYTKEQLEKIFEGGPPQLDSIIPPVPGETSSEASAESLITGSKDIDKFLPGSDSSTDFFISLYEKLYHSIISYINPVYTQGYFDDLIGQRLFIEFLLFTLSVFILVLFFAFILNLVFYMNKEKILSLLPKNKYFIFIFNIEISLIKWTLIIVPFIIFIGFFSIIHGHLWLMSHPIPYQELGIDLHQFVSVQNKNDLTLLPLLCCLKTTRSNIVTNSSINRRYINNKLDSSKKLNLYNYDSPIFKILMSILNNEKKSSETQIKIENLLLNQVSNIYNNPMKNSVNHKILLVLQENKEYIAKSIQNLKSNLNLTSEDSKATSNSNSLYNQIISTTKLEFLINIMFGRVLAIIANKDLASTKSIKVDVIISLSKELENNFLFELYNKFKESNNEVSFYNWKKDNIKLFQELEDTQLRFYLGNTLINILLDLELIEENLVVLEKDNKLTVLIPGVKFNNTTVHLTWKNLNQILPKNIPMIVPPKKFIWDSTKGDYTQLGGYYLNDVFYANDVILPNWQLATETKLLSKNDICDMVNILNSIPFKINVDVLDYIIKNNDKYHFYIDFNYEHPLTLKKKLSIKDTKELQAFQSKKDLEYNIICLAILFREVDCFYFPVRLDFRGRVYCITEYLNYQGIELAKGILSFHNQEKIYITDSQSIDFLKIYGANSFGNKLDKKSFKDRILWVDTNIENIINFDNGILLNQAENKILFLSFCFEFKKYIQALNNKDNFFMSDLPIQLDATCNGFQHLSLLIEDIALSKELNLGNSTKSDVPKDFYSYIAFKLKEHFNSLIMENKISPKLSAEMLQSYERLAKLDIHRSLIKKAVMTIPYNASALSIINYIKDEFEIQFLTNDENKVVNSNTSNNQEINTLPSTDSRKSSDKFIYVHKINKSIKLKNIDFKNLRLALNKVIFVDFPQLNALSQYLKTIANIANTLNIPILWILPSGLVISQQYFESKVIKVKPNVYSNKTVSLTVLDKKGFNLNKQKVALMPNLVHSLDAASLCLVIIEFFKCTGNTSFYSIHDCFAVHCNKIDILNETLKSAYCVIYSNKKYLLEFDNNFRNNIKQIFGKENVLFNDIKGDLEVIGENNTKIKIKYPSINDIVSNDIKVNFTESTYLIN